MRNSNGYGYIYKLQGNRRKPYAVKTNSFVYNGKRYSFYINYFVSLNEAKTCLKTFNEDINFRNSILTQKLEKIGKVKKVISTTPIIQNIDTPTIPNQDILKQPKNDISNIDVGVSTSSSVKEVFDKFIEYKKDFISAATLENYNTSFNSIQAIHNDIFTEITFNDLNKFISPDNFTYNTALKAKSLLTLLYDFMIVQQIITVNYGKYLKISKELFENNARQITIFSDEEISLLWEKRYAYPFAKVILFMLYTGVRSRELLNIKNSDFDLEARCLRITTSKTKAGENRIIPLSNKIIPIIKELMSPSEYFVTNAKGTQMKPDNFLRDNFKKTLFYLGMDHNPHETRHTFITKLNKLGANEVSITKIVGHKSSLVTTNTYTHLEKEELLKAIDLI